MLNSEKKTAVEHDTQRLCFFCGKVYKEGHTCSPPTGQPRPLERPALPAKGTLVKVFMAKNICVECGYWLEVGHDCRTSGDVYSRRKRSPWRRPKPPVRC